jgi:lipopolysaccharide transport system permease protein
LNPANDIEDWTQIIEPKSKWYQINLKEIWDYRDLILIFVRRDIVSTYKQTILGPLWLFLGPLFTVVVYVFVFDKIAGISTDDIPAPLFYLAGTTMWNYFQSCINATSNTFVNNAGIFGKVYFPRLVSPISVVISNLLKFGIQMGMFLCFFFYYYFQEGSNVYPNITLLTLPILVVLMGGIALGTGIIVSSLTTKYRDLSYFISFGITLIMYATPVIYPISSIPLAYRPILHYNPIAPLIEAFRYSFTGNGEFSISGLMYSFTFMVVVLTVGILLFTRTEKTFMDTV